MTQMETLQQSIHDSGNIVFFEGAGVSTESGIPDFRSAGGLYRRMNQTKWQEAKPQWSFMVLWNGTTVHPAVMNINRSDTTYDGKASLVIRDNIGGVLEKIRV